MLSQSKTILPLVLATVLAACDGGMASDRESREVPRIRVDAERNLLWVLDHEGVWVHNNRTGRLVQRVVLPGWILAGRKYSCPPDLVLDQAGSAFVSSNVLPMLWRIDPSDRFEVTQLALALDADHGKDVGFSGLSFASDGTLFAVNAVLGSLWRIDVSALSARKVMAIAPVPGACDLNEVLRPAA